MSDVNYARHFALLLLAGFGLMLWFEPIVDSIPIERPFSSFGLFGLLHASAWVMSVRKASFLRRLAFVAVATVLSMAVFFSPVILVPVADIVRGSDPFFVLPVTISACGAFVYWHAMRAFWLPPQRVWSLPLTVFVCAVATAVAFTSGGSQDLVATPLSYEPHIGFFTLLWWSAFSFSILVANRGWRPLPVTRLR